MARIPSWWETIDVDAFVIMPNHVHVIVAISGKNTPETKKPKLGHTIGSYKAGVLRAARQQNIIDDGYPIWQSCYHDHIIRDADDGNRIREYVHHNPALWEKDTFFA